MFHTIYKIWILRGNEQMKLPKMILFDYGQTLVTEQKFDGVSGTRAVLQYATINKYNLTAEQVQDHANEINMELGRLDPAKRSSLQVEIPNSMFSPYLYESVGIELSIRNGDVDKVFWDAASPGKPTDGIEAFLNFLKQKGIRTGVISNITYDQNVVSERINRLIPDNEFEFIIATSSYLFRKPNRHIFELALEKANLATEDVWYIGDNYICDVKGALGAGLFPVWYIGAMDLPYTEDKEICTVSSWQELMKMMESMELKDI